MDEPSTWWFTLAFPLALLMLEAMMQFTSTLLERRPRKRSNRIPAGELEKRLLEIDFGHLLLVRRGDRGGLEIRGYDTDNAWSHRAARLKFTTAYQARLVLDENRHEARWFESVRSSGFFFGFTGWRPRFHFNFWYRSGYLNLTWVTQVYAIEPGFPPRMHWIDEFAVNTVELKKVVTRVVNQGGWTFRPVTLRFYASPWWLAFTNRVVPARIRRLPRRWLWGVVYPASYLLLTGYLAGLLRLIDPESWNRDNLLIVLLVSAGWWGTWGLLAWALAGFSGFGRLLRSRSK